jgi:hypothetical protein
VGKRPLFPRHVVHNAQDTPPASALPAGVVSSHSGAGQAQVPRPPLRCTLVPAARGVAIAAVHSAQSRIAGFNLYPPRRLATDTDRRRGQPHSQSPGPTREPPPHPTPRIRFAPRIFLSSILPSLSDPCLRPSVKFWRPWPFRAPKSFT